MRAEKKILTKDYVARLNASPFFIVIGYKGLKVAHLTELRKRLVQAERNPAATDACKCAVVHRRAE